MRPRLYFDTHVTANFAAWGNDPKNIDRARCATVAADALADRIFNYLHPVRPSAVANAPSAGAYRRHLVDCEPDYQIVWDAARGLLLLTVGVLPFKAREADGVDVATIPSDIIVVTLRNGEKRALRASVGKVLKMWEAILRDQRL